MKAFLVFAVLSLVIFAGCQKKVEPVPVGEMSEYRDPGYGFKIKYPKEWRQMGTTGKALFAKSQEVVDKFQNPTQGEEGAMVAADVMLYEGKKASDLIESAKNDLKQNATLGPDEQTTVGGKPATKIPYTIKVTSKKSITGYELLIPGDTAMYKLDISGFGEQFNAHAAVFDAMIKSYELPVIVAKKPDTWNVSANLETYKQSAFFTMEYPDNMEFVPVSKGNNDFAMEMRADRKDCSIHIDVFGAKGLTVEKVWEQNKGRYKSKGTGEAKISGAKAVWVDYSPVKEINSRAYFVVNNDKVIRTTINYFAPQKEIYFPVLDKCVSSIKFK
jgi:hypothetical protein